MKIGDRIFVRGYVDEIRKDTVIVRNDGGYFGTVLSEVTGELPSSQPEKRTEERTETHACDLIDRQVAIDAIMGQPPEPHYPSWYAAQIEKLPAVQPATSCSEIPNSSTDCISRRAAIDALDCINGAEEVLRALPSVQPDHTADVSKKVSISCGQENDLISRQAAIDCVTYDVEHTIECLKALPSAQPEQNGKWIYNSPMTMKCDRCGFAIKDWDWHKFKFCPNCGADMRGGGSNE